MRLPSRPSLPRARGLLPRSGRARLAGVLVVLLAAGVGGGWLWLRQSSLARIQHVTVRGASGDQGTAIARALRLAAQEMTTLDVHRAKLQTAVAAYPQVKDVRVTTDFPHKATITVVLRRPVAALSVGRRRVPIAADGTLLRGTPDADLPVVRADAPPAGPRLEGGSAAGALALVAEASRAMRRHVERVDATRDGFQAQLRNGPRVLLGTAARGRAKWIAAGRVLGDSGSDGAGYIDVRLPERPAVGDLQASTGG